MRCLRRRLPVVLSLLALTAALSAAETPVAGAESCLVVVVPAEQILEPAPAITLHLNAENRGDTELGANVHWTL